LCVPTRPVSFRSSEPIGTVTDRIAWEIRSSSHSGIRMVKRVATADPRCVYWAAPQMTAGDRSAAMPKKDVRSSYATNLYRRRAEHSVRTADRTAPRQPHAPSEIGRPTFPATVASAGPIGSRAAARRVIDGFSFRSNLVSGAGFLSRDETARSRLDRDHGYHSQLNRALAAF
jgi:hypothetical protein